MATYYINADNASGVYPYNTIDNGFPNFNDLLTTVSLIDGDSIIVSTPSGTPVDDSAQTITINSSINILGLKILGESPKVKLNPTMGMSINMANVEIKDISLFADTYSGVLLYIIANDVTVDSCTFGYNANSVTGVVIAINVNSHDNITIKDNIITLPKNTVTLSFGIYLNNVSYSKVTGNTVKMKETYAQGISIIGNSDYNDICYNVVGVFSESDASISNIHYGLLFYGNYNTVHNNVIGLAGNTAVGIEYGITPTTGINILISNNYINVYEKDFGSIGIHIPYQTSTISHFTIIDNIIEYTGNGDYSSALNISIQRGVIDYNDIYNFKETNVFFSGGGPNLLSLGRYNIFSDPKLFYSQEPKDDEYSIENFYCYKNSECIGSGYLHHNIGVGVDPIITTNTDNYINIIDTVTYNYGFGTANKSSYNSFFNSVFTEKSEDFNVYYRSTTGVPYLSEIPELKYDMNYSVISSNYPSYFDTEIGVYRNQFEFNISPNKFPFSTDDTIFYNKDLTTVCFYKDKLSPFSGISCPPNPGYGYPDYENYTKGLWGYLRYIYPNSCASDGCIIQDVISNVTQIQDITNATIWVQDMINPPCINP